MRLTTSLIENDPIVAYPSDQFSSSNSYVNAWVDRDSLVGFINLIKIDSNRFVAAYILEGSEGINVDIGATDKSEGEGSQKGMLFKDYLIPFNSNYADKNKILERQTIIKILESCTDEYGNLYHVMESFDTDTWDKGILELIKLDRDGRLVFRSEISEKALASITGLGVDEGANILVTGNTEYPETNVFAQKYNGENGELLWEIFPFEDAYEGFSIRNSESSLTIIEDGTALIAGAGYFYPSQQGSQIVSNYIAEINTNLGTVIGLHKVDDGHYSENDYWSHEFSSNSEGLYFRTFKGNYLVNGTNSPINIIYKTGSTAPSNINISSLLFDESIAPESIVATLTATDENPSDNFTYSLVSGIGDADNDLFAINGDQLIINTSPNYEARDSYSVRIQATDSGGLNFSKSFVLTVSDLLEIPPTPIPEPAPELEVENQINRLYNPSQGKHLFSSSQYEIDLLTGRGWVNEGVIYNAPTEATTDVFRFYIPAEGRHFYTALEAERDIIIGNQETFSGWVYEGPAFSAYSTSDFPEGAVAVVRYLNQETGSHVYSTSTFEQGILDQDSLWLNEGIAWYGDPMA